MAELLRPNAMPTTMPVTSPAAHPARQCSMALTATAFNEDLLADGMSG